MTADLLTSPFARWHDAFAAPGADLRLDDRPFLAQLSLRLDPDGPAVAAVVAVLGVDLPGPGRATPPGALRVLWLGPDEWLVLGAPGTAAALAARLTAALGDAPGAVVDVSAQRAALALSGPRVLDVLAKGCSLDLDPAVRPPGSCVTTLLAQAGVTLVLDGPGADHDGGGGSVLVLVRPSFADYLARWLLDAAVEID